MTAPAVVSPTIPSAADVGGALEKGNYRISCENPQIVIGSRTVPGNPRARRWIVFSRPADGVTGWRGYSHWVPAGPVIRSIPLAESREPQRFLSLVELTFWIGSVSSIPCNKAEELAIMRGEIAQAL